MSDHDLLETFARETTQQVLAPDFDALVAVSRRRRRTTYLAAGSAAAVVVGMIAVGMQVVDDNQGQAPVGPVPTTVVTHPTPSSPTDSTPSELPRVRTPQQIVDDPRSAMRSLAVSPSDPDVKAAVWAFCPKRSCQHPQEAVAVTKDGYQTAAYLQVEPYTDLQWVRDDVFVVSDAADTLLLVSATESHTLSISTTPSPLLPGERLVTMDAQSTGDHEFLAVDAETATAHPLTIPYSDDKSLQLHQQGAETLWGTDDSNAIVSSGDGGATWHPAFSPPGVRQLDPLDSVAPNVVAALSAGDDDSRSAETLYRSTDSGASWQSIQPAQFKHLGAGWAVVLGDGNLLITVSPYRGFSAVPRLYESSAMDWQHFHEIHPTGGLPPGYLLGATLDPQGVTNLWLNGADGLLRSVDQGRTWTATPAR